MRYLVQYFKMEPIKSKRHNYRLDFLWRSVKNKSDFRQCSTNFLQWVSTTNRYCEAGIHGPPGPRTSVRFSLVRVRSDPRVLKISWSASGPVRESQNFLGPRPVRSADRYFLLASPVRFFRNVLHFLTFSRLVQLWFKMIENTALSK